MVKNPTVTIEFGEQDENFIKQLAKDINCHYYKANKRTYNLNKCDSDIHSEMGVFAWVHKENKDSFWITTRKVWVEKAKSRALVSEGVSGVACFPIEDQPGDSVFLDTKAGYRKTVRALSLVRQEP